MSKLSLQDKGKKLARSKSLAERWIGESIGLKSVELVEEPSNSSRKKQREKSE